MADPSGLFGQVKKVFGNVSQAVKNKDYGGIDTKEVADTAADVIGAAAKYGNVDDTSLGGYADKTQNFLKGYSSGGKGGPTGGRGGDVDQEYSDGGSAAEGYSVSGGNDPSHVSYDQDTTVGGAAGEGGYDDVTTAADAGGKEYSGGGKETGGGDYRDDSTAAANPSQDSYDDNEYSGDGTAAQ